MIEEIEGGEITIGIMEEKGEGTKIDHRIRERFEEYKHSQELYLIMHAL